MHAPIRRLKSAECVKTMFVIEAVSRECSIRIKRSKVRKINHTFLPKGFHIADISTYTCTWDVGYMLDTIMDKPVQVRTFY